MVSSVLLTVLASYTIVCVLLTLVVASFVLATLWKRSSSKLSATAYHSGELFVVARGAGNVWLITWSFVAGVNGAWMPATAGYFSYSYGLAGMLCFCIATASQPLVCMILSKAAYKQLKEANSFPESVGARYGHTLEAFTVGVMLLVSTLFLAGELVAVADLFESVMGIDRRLVFATAALFSVYSTFIGGALVGLIMSQFNNIIAVVTAAALLVFFLASAKGYRPPSSQALLWGANTDATLLAFPGMLYSNVTLAAFAEVFWQKHIWCRRKSELWPAACYAGVISTALGCLWGMAAVVAAWKDAAERTFYYGDTRLPFILYLDRYWKGANLRSIWAAQHYWFGVTLLIQVAVSSHAALEGWNSSLLSSAYGSLRLRALKKHRLDAARGVVMALNALAFAAAVKPLNPAGLFTAGNTIAACLLFPLFLSICSRRMFAVASSTHILLSAISGLVACSAYGVADVQRTSGGTLGRAEAALKGLKHAFYTNNYEWPYLVISLFVPLAVYSCCIGLSILRVVFSERRQRKVHQAAASARAHHVPWRMTRAHGPGSDFTW